MLLIYGLALAQMLIFLGITIGVARAFGVGARIIGFGAPAVLRVRKASPEIRLGPLPTASVELAGVAVEDGARVTYRGLSRGKRLAIVLAPWIAILGISIGCIGFEPAMRSLARGFGQILVTVDLTPLVRKMIAIADHAPIGVTAGILLAKLAAMNLLPFGGVAGGMFIMQAVTPPDRDVPRGVLRFMMITLAAWMLWTLGRLVWVVIALAR